MQQAAIDLGTVKFSSTETVLAEWLGMCASVFRFGSGVKALRIRNALGSILLLPFQGQQIWDAEFLGRRLTMKTMFDEPVETGEYLRNYGAFFLHCGLLAMGNPGPQDRHALHGELPNAKFQDAQLIIGTDGDGPYMGLAGRCERKEAFTTHYEAEPRVTLHQGHSFVDMGLSVWNRFHRPMSLMYLAHINFRPIDGGRIHDTVPDDPRYIRLRTTVPEFFTQTEAHKHMIAEIGADLARHRDIAKGRPIDPELVMGLDFRQGSDGLAHTLMEHPDGTSDFVSHRPADLPRAVRWMTRTEDQDAIGIVLPSTAEADGFAAEQAKGNVKWLEFGEEWRFHMRFGALDGPGTAALKHRIADIRAGF